MPDIKIQDIIDRHFGTQEDFIHAADYTLFRAIEDWCMSNIDRTQWRFDYSSTINACGISLPGRIIFKRKEDLTAFTLRFGR